MRRAVLWAPLALFAALLVLVGLGFLKPADRAVRPAMTDKPLPDFILPAMLPGKPGVSSTGYGGGPPRRVNLFASWCVPVGAAGFLFKSLPIDAIAVNDLPDAVRSFLAHYGDPYQRIGDDRRGRVQVALGSAGVPETFLIDGRGRIVRQYVSNLQDDQVADILAAWRAAK